MDFITEPILALVGFLYLKLRYRDNNSITKILNEKYHGKYQAVGVAILLNCIAALGVLVTASMIGMVIYKAIKDSEFFPWDTK